MQLRTCLFGLDTDYNPKHAPEHTWLRKIRTDLEIAWGHIYYPVFSPRAAFTNRVAQLTDDDRTLWGFFCRSKEPADGAIVLGANRGVAIFNADCPIICLTSGDKLAVLHAGYRCLIREKNDEGNIIESAMSHFMPSETNAWIGYGIGPCCWIPEFNNYPEIGKPALCRHSSLLENCLSRTTRSPDGLPHTSVDLYALAYGLLREAGILSTNINWDTRCTCCATKYNGPAYWSHTRFKASGGVDGRNFCLAWLTH